MLLKRQLLSQDNLNNAFLSKTNTSTQTIAGNIIVSGGVITLKNSVISDAASTTYLRIDPQGNKIIIYDGVSNQSLEVYSSSGSEATAITTVNQASNQSYGQIDAQGSSVNHLRINTNSGKHIKVPLSGMQFGISATNTDNFYMASDTSGGTRGFRIYNGTADSHVAAPVISLQSGNNIGINIASSPLGGVNSARTYLTIKGATDAGVLELTQGSADAADSMVGQVQFTDFNGGSGGADKRIAGIVGWTEGTSGGTRGGRLSFYTRPNGNPSGYLEKMRINQSGNVSIGDTVNHTALLLVSRSTNAGEIMVIRNQSNGSSAYSSLYLGNDTADNKLIMFTNSSSRTADGGIGNSTIRTDSGKLYLGAAGVSFITVDTVQRLGISNTSPSYPLDVTGDIRATGAVRVTSAGTTMISGGAVGSLRVTTPNGWLDLGPQNSSYNHIVSDGKPLYLYGGNGTSLGIYYDYTLRPFSTTGRMVIPVGTNYYAT